MYKLGVDPGLTGAIALLQDDQLVDIWDMPTTTATHGKGKVVSPQLLHCIIGEIRALIAPASITIAYLEQVAARWLAHQD